jgi:hypothetical protein
MATPLSWDTTPLTTTRTDGREGDLETTLPLSVTGGPLRGNESPNESTPEHRHRYHPQTDDDDDNNKTTTSSPGAPIRRPGMNVTILQNHAHDPRILN